MDTYESEKNCTTHSPVVQKKKTQKKKMEERKIATVIENPSFSTSTNGPSSDSTKKIDSPVQILNNSENSENSGVANQPNELNGPNEPISSNASSSNSSVVSHLKKIEEKFEIDEHIFTWNSDEFVFYDIETTWESPRDIIEFGAIVLDKYGLYEKRIYSTLIHSVNITDKSIECNGITREMVLNSPKFVEVADTIYQILNGKIWFGHNIIGFDNKEIEKAFQKIDKPPPKPCAIVDTYLLIRKSPFGTRVGNLKISTLSQFFGLGIEKHRALSDSQMTLDIFKNICVTLMLEKCFNISLKPPSHILPPIPTKPSTPKRNSSSNSTRQDPHTPKKDSSSSNSTSTGQEPHTPIDSKSLFKEKELHPKSTYKFVADTITKILQDKDYLYIRYQGGNYENKPRMMQPIAWKSKPWTFEAYCFISHCIKSFAVSKITLIGKEEHDSFIMNNKNPYDKLPSNETTNEEEKLDLNVPADK